MTDVMQRLRAADPVASEPDAPPVEWMLDQLARTPVATWEVDGPRRVPPARRAPRRALLGGLAAIAGLAAAVAMVGGSSSRDIVAEASEALAADGAVVHTVFSYQQLDENGAPTGNRNVQFSRKPKRYGRGDVQVERWTVEDPRRERVISTVFAADGGPNGISQTTYANGVYRFDSNLDHRRGIQTFRVPERFRKSSDSPEPHLGAPGSDPVADIRGFLADKELEPAGETVVDGRTLLTLRGQVASRKLKGGFVTPELRVEYLVDPQTYEPVRMDQRPFKHGKDGSLKPMEGFRIVFKTYERLPMTDSNLALLRMHR
jgi:hypothetical protein